MRAFLHDTQEFFYADSSKPLDLINFYSILEGYRLKGRKFAIDKPSGVSDIHNTEVYENDKVRVIYLLTADQKAGGLRTVEVGWVLYDDCCFVIENNDENYYEYLGTSILAADAYRLEVIGRRDLKPPTPFNPAKSSDDDDDDLEIDFESIH